jgi:hypothetical protein
MALGIRKVPVLLYVALAAILVIAFNTQRSQLSLLTLDAIRSNSGRSGKQLPHFCVQTTSQHIFVCHESIRAPEATIFVTLSMSFILQAAIRSATSHRMWTA